MAGMTRYNRDRGQLLIIGAVGIAILLIALALAMNVAVYGEVHVSQTQHSHLEEQDVLAYQASVERVVDQLRIASQSEDVDYEELEARFHANVALWNHLDGSHAATDGIGRSVTSSDVTFDTTILQPETAAFQDYSGNTNWTVVSDAERVDEYRLTVEHERLTDTESCTDEEDCFRLSVVGADGNEWNLSVYSPPDPENIAVTVMRTAGEIEQCESTAESLSINLTAGTLTGAVGESCQITSFTEDTGLEAPYTIAYEHGDAITGTYTLLFPGRVTADIDSDPRYDTIAAPRIDPAIAGATVSLEFRSPRLAYERDIRIQGGDT